MKGLFPFLFAMPLVMGCASSSGDTLGTTAWSALPNAHATHFELQVRGAERRVVVFGPEGRNDTVGKYVYRGSDSARSIPVPVGRVVVLSTTYLPFFGALNAVEQVVGMAYVNQIRDPRFSDAVAQGRLQEVSRADGVDRERLLSLAPQVVFDHPFGSGERRTGTFANTVLVTEYLEEHPLGRAEWVRFFGVLLGMEQRADSVFNAVEHRYEVLREMNAHLSRRPTVLFGSHWEGAWFAPAGNSYMATLINDAGGRYAFSDTMASGNIGLPLERLVAMGDTIDHLGVLLAAEGPVNKATLVGGDSRIMRLNCVRHGAFVGNSAANDIFGQALLEPDEVLRDLRCIFHPGSCGGRQGRYFRALNQ